MVPGYRIGQSPAGKRIERLSHDYQILLLKDRFAAVAARLAVQGAILGDSLEERLLEMNPKPATSHAGAIYRIILDTADKYGISMSNMLGDVRTVPVVAARHEAMYRAAVEVPTQSLAAIGRVLRKDHTTIRHGLIAYAARHGLPIPRGIDGERHMRSVENTRRRARESKARQRNSRSVAGLTSQGIQGQSAKL